MKMGVEFGSYEEKIVFEKLKEIENLVFIHNNDDLFDNKERVEAIKGNICRLQKMNSYDYYAPLASDKIHTGALVIRVKGLIRKSVAFIMGPIIAWQAETNAVLLDTVRLQAEVIESLIQREKARMTKTETMIGGLSQKTEMLEKKIELIHETTGKDCDK